MLTPGCNLDTIGYLKKSKTGGSLKIYRRLCVRDDNGNVILNSENKPQWQHLSGVNGKEMILRKIDLVRTYLKEHFDIDLDELRKKVQERTYITKEDGTFLLDQWGDLQNKLTSIQESGKTLMDELRDEVNKYKALQESK